MKKCYLFLFFFYATFIASSQQNPNFEFRAVWIATVDNIDWPSKKTLTVEEQKAEYIKILELHQRNGMNALIVQVRPAADAFYPSQYEPWSEFLTGKQGSPPDPYYDPLQFMIEETHKRGMEFHAWLNPYRAVFNINKSSVAPSHITRIKPDWFLVYGDKKYFDPGIPEVRQHTARVVRDLVNRYDLDAIHMDDYFYPYRIANKEFPDGSSYNKYGSGLSKDDWRRSNCDSIIKLLHETIINTKPWVKFGISPFGVWRNASVDPRGSNTKAGQTNYDDLYADILLWLKNGWMDYVLPQLYWERGFKLADYDTLLDWWNKNSFGKHLYIGHGIYRVGGKGGAWNRKNELPEQIQLLRTFSTTHGSAYFSSKSFNNNPNGWNDSLQNNYYATPSIVPPMPWIDDVAPQKPVIQKNSTNEFLLQYNGDERIRYFAIFSGSNILEKAKLIKLIVADKKTSIQVNQPPFIGKKIYCAVVDWNNNVSSFVVLE